MRSRILPPAITLAVALGIFGAFVIIAATGADVEPAAKTKILSIPAAAFNELRWGTDWYARRTGGSLSTVPTGAFSPDIGKYSAPVMLPHGAVIKEVRFYVKNNESPAVSMTLKRFIVAGGATSEQTLATVTSGTFVATYTLYKTTAIATPTVNNIAGCYSLELYLPDVEANDVFLHHAEIVYTGKW